MMTSMMPYMTTYMHVIKSSPAAGRTAGSRILAAALFTLLSVNLMSTVAKADTSKNYAAKDNTADDVVNVYSYRQPFLVEPLFAEFTKTTGIDVRVVFAKKGLIERIQTEGKNAPADVLLTVDISRLINAAETIAQPVNSPLLAEYIPASARGSDNKWFALTYRARVAYVSRERVGQEALSYADLAAPAFKGRVCMRSGQHPYNNALFASQLAHMGEKNFRTWLTGLKNNLSEKPSGNDRAQVRRIYGGACDVAIGNTYYMGKMETNTKKPEQKDWARAVRIIFPDTENRGTHVNVSGMVMARYAPNRANALKLMEFLVSEQAQRIYAEMNFEYPVRASVEPSPRVAGWGTLKPDPLPLETIASYRKRAAEIVDEVGFNN